MTDTLAQKAYQALRQRLRTGQLAPGARLVHRSLAAELGFSFTPVREALGRLASEGFVEHVPGAGSRVRVLSRTDLAQLYDLRANLEPFAAAEAARHISALELEELTRSCEEFEAIARELQTDGQPTPETHQRWLGAEEHFHELLIRAARNPWLSKVAVDLRVLALVFTSQSSVASLLTPAVAQATWREHAELLERLRQRDVEGSRSWMEAHVLAGRSHVLEHFE